MDPLLVALARETSGFMPHDEGLALLEAGLEAGEIGPLLEIGSYCGLSALYLGDAARRSGIVLYSIDHHKGSEEHQPGEGYHDPRLVDGAGQVDTLPRFVSTIRRAGLEAVVLGIAARSEELARVWSRPLGLVFIDGGHSAETASADLRGWVPHLLPGGLLCIHDVFPDPADGGPAPYAIYQEALGSGTFEEAAAVGSLRVVRRI